MKKSLLKKVELFVAALVMISGAEAMDGIHLDGRMDYSSLDPSLQSIFEPPTDSSVLRLRKRGLNSRDIAGTRRKIKVISSSRGLLDGQDRDISLAVLQDLLNAELDRKLEKRMSHLTMAKEVFTKDLGIPKTRTAEKEVILQKRISFLQELVRSNYGRRELQARLSVHIDINGGSKGETLFGLEWSSYLALKKEYDSADGVRRTLDALELLCGKVKKDCAENVGLSDDALLNSVFGSVSPSLDYKQLGPMVHGILRSGQDAVTQVQGLQLQLRKTSGELRNAQKEIDVLRRRVDELNRKLLDNNSLVRDAAAQYAEIAQYKREIDELKSLAPVIQLTDPRAVEQLMAVGVSEQTSKLLAQAQDRIMQLEAEAFSKVNARSKMETLPAEDQVNVFAAMVRKDNTLLESVKAAAMGDADLSSY